MLNTTTTAQKIGKISLVLSYAPLGLVRALSTRIWHDSMLVDTGCITLCDNCEVGIVLSLQDGERHSTHRIRARVVGNGADGVRLAFQDCDHATLKALKPYISTH